MKNFSKEQQLIIRLANSLSQMIDTAESEAAHQDIGEIEETDNNGNIVMMINKE